MDVRVDRKRLVEWASHAIATPSFTGSEQELATVMAETFKELGLRVQWQQVEQGRANVLGILEGSGGGPTLMFNGHMDTSYSGREPWLKDVPGFQPQAFVRGGRLYGLGISNMKGAVAAYVEAVRSLMDDRGHGSLRSTLSPAISTTVVPIAARADSTTSTCTRSIMSV